MGEPWEATDWTNVQDFPGTFKTSFRPVRPSGGGVSPRIDFQVWVRREGEDTTYAVGVIGEKAGRSVAYANEDVKDVEDIKNPGKFIKSDFIRKYKDSLGGSFDDEFAAIREYSSKLLIEAQQAQETAEDIAALVRQDILKNADALKELTWSLRGHSLDSHARYIMDTINTIRKEMGLRD